MYNIIVVEDDYNTRKLMCTSAGTERLPACSGK